MNKNQLQHKTHRTQETVFANDKYHIITELLTAYPICVCIRVSIQVCMRVRNPVKSATFGLRQVHWSIMSFYVVVCVCVTCNFCTINFRSPQKAKKAHHYKVGQADVIFANRGICRKNCKWLFY